MALNYWNEDYIDPVNSSYWHNHLRGVAVDMECGQWVMAQIAQIMCTATKFYYQFLGLWVNIQHPKSDINIYDNYWDRAPCSFSTGLVCCTGKWNSINLSQMPHTTSEKLVVNSNSFKNQFSIHNCGICGTFAEKHKISEAGWSKSGNGTHRTKNLVWLQFVSVSTNRIFPAETLFAVPVPKLADQRQEI